MHDSPAADDGEDGDGDGDGDDDDHDDGDDDEPIPFFADWPQRRGIEEAPPVVVLASIGARDQRFKVGGRRRLSCRVSDAHYHCPTGLPINLGWRASHHATTSI